MRWWQLFDEEEVKRDFARLRTAGFDSVRIFLLWEDFQPAPDHVSEQALTRLVRVADAAHDNDLRLMPTLFTGHMSGVNWIPRWAVDAESRPECSSPEARFRIVANNQVISGIAKNWFSDETVGSAQERLAGAAAEALRGHPALWAWDLGNENSNCCIPPTRQAAVAWLKRMSTRIRSATPEAAITIGLHMEDLIEDRRLGPQEAGSFCDFLCMHGYPIYADFVESPTDERLLPFLGLMTCWLGEREVLFAEFGTPALRAGTLLDQARFASPQTTLLDEDSAATFTRRALAALHCFGFLGAMLWCYGDYVEPLWTGCAALLWLSRRDALVLRGLRRTPLDRSTPGRGNLGTLVRLVARRRVTKTLGHGGELLRTHRTGIASAMFPLDRHRSEGILHTSLRTSMPTLPALL